MTAAGGAVRRIRSPHPNDVLSGRGGGINAHEGNKRFREQVALRKEDYNLAPNKAEKTRIATEVMETIIHQNPPGRFLQRDESIQSGPTWWVEVNEVKALAKTSQALREGAPQIRLAHQDELHQRAVDMSKTGTKRKVKNRSIAKPTGETHSSKNPSRSSNPALSASNSSSVLNVAPQVGPTVPVRPALSVVSRGRLPVDQYNRAIEQLEENAREAQSQAIDEAESERKQQQHHQQQYPAGGIGIIAPLTSNKEFAERYWSPPSKRPRIDDDRIVHAAAPSMDGGVRVMAAYPRGIADTEVVDVMADTPPLIPAPAPFMADTGMAAFNLGSSSSSNGLKRNWSTGLRNTGRGITRTHSLAFSDVNPSDLDVEDGDFVNPFADESDVASKVLLLDDLGDDGQSTTTSAPETPGAMLRNLSSNEGINGGNNIVDTPMPFVGSNWANNATTSRSMNELSDLINEDSEFQGSWENDFGEGMKSILDVVHPDLTSPEKGDSIPTLLMPWRGFGGGMSHNNTSNSIIRRTSVVSSNRNRIIFDGRQ